MNICSLFVAHSQSPKLIQPGEGPFGDPPPLPQPTAVFRVAFGKQRNDVSRAQMASHRLGVIAAISDEAIRTMAWATSLSDQMRNSIDQS